MDDGLKTVLDHEHNITPGPPGPISSGGVLELLERIDVVKSAVEDRISLEAMKEFWSGRPDHREES